MLNGFRYVLGSLIVVSAARSSPTPGGCPPATAAPGCGLAAVMFSSAGRVARGRGHRACAHRQ
ncbi:hypothetical protein QJS66_01865 [Kocuria rhizophila]|nr:hypothetical protein QJS66_01865 [Kocuria rhizophila]